MITSIIDKAIVELEGETYQVAREKVLSECILNIVRILDNDTHKNDEKQKVIFWLNSGSAHVFSATYDEVMYAHLLAMREAWSTYDQAYRIAHSALNYSILWVESQLSENITSNKTEPSERGVNALFDMIALILLDEGDVDDDLKRLMARHDVLRWYLHVYKNKLETIQKQTETVLQMAKTLTCKIGLRGERHIMYGHAIETVICMPGQVPVLHHETGEMLVRHLTIFTNIYSLFEQGVLDIGDIAIRSSRTTLSHLSLCLSLRSQKRQSACFRPWVVIDISKQGIQITTNENALHEQLNDGDLLDITLPGAFYQDKIVVAQIKWIRTEKTSVFLGLQLIEDRVDDSYLKMLQKKI